MAEYIIYGALALISVVVFASISVAKAKIGWSFVKEEE